ncbi:MAG TPA: hypothetical protein VJP06_03665 [Thermoplasmata archaeon]|nr:hypothetical protein [Thermoplasmata archaeon]
MAGLKKLVGVTLAAVLIAAVVVYVLRPNATQSKTSVVSEPGPTNGPSTPVPKPDTGDEWSHKRTPSGSGGTPNEQPPSDQNCTDDDHGHDRDGGSCDDHDHGEQGDNGSDWNSDDHSGHDYGSDKHHGSSDEHDDD